MTTLFYCSFCRMDFTAGYMSANGKILCPLCNSIIVTRKIVEDYKEAK